MNLNRLLLSTKADTENKKVTIRESEEIVFAFSYSIGNTEAVKAFAAMAV